MNQNPSISRKSTGFKSEEVFTFTVKHSFFGKSTFVLYFEYKTNKFGHTIHRTGQFLREVYLDVDGVTTGPRIHLTADKTYDIKELKAIALRDLDS